MISKLTFEFLAIEEICPSTKIKFLQLAKSERNVMITSECNDLAENGLTIPGSVVLR